jgi:methylated-DNA-[protein]-cysteine S-methyltransferase
MSLRFRFAITSPSPIGTWRILSDGNSIVGLYSERHREPVATDESVHVDDLCQEARRQLSEYFAGERRQFDLPLAPFGTQFDRRVWDALLEIPFGTTWSYGQLARHIGQPTAARAVGAANGRNPIGLVIPCHRVIGSNGKHVGYGGGLDVKAWLLDHEMMHSGLLSGEQAAV